MDRYQQLEELERGAVRHLHSRSSRHGRRLSAQELAGLLNHIAAQWGCHYTVRAEHLKRRKGGDPYSFRT